MTAKLRRDVTANTAKIETVNFDWSLAKLLGQIDVEAIADHWPARFNGIGVESDGPPLRRAPILRRQVGGSRVQGRGQTPYRLDQAGRFAGDYSPVPVIALTPETRLSINSVALV
jgi:hypothetical protein